MSQVKLDPTDQVDPSTYNEPERERCRTDLLYLARTYMHYEDMDDTVHGDLVAQLHKYIAGCKAWVASRTLAKKIKGVFTKKHKYPVPVVFELFRGALKTSLLTISWVIQRILIDPNITMRIITYGTKRSIEIYDELREHLKNPELVKLFPDILWENPKKNSSKWGDNALNVKRTRVVAGYTVKVDSIMGGITGSHCDIMVFDDPHDIENTETPELIHKVIERFRNCRSVLKPGGWRIIIGTIWKKDDFYAWCAEKGFQIYRRVATYNSKGEECDCDDPDAHSYFPGLFPLEELRQIKKEIGRKRYAGQYNLKPLADEDIKFTEEMLKSYSDDPVYKKIWILVDPALSRTKKADSSVICVVGQPKDENQRLKVLKSRELRVKPRALIDAMLDEYIWHSHLPGNPEVYLGIEAAQLQFILAEWLKEAMQKLNLYFEVHELKHGNKPKEERVNKLLPLFENGAIELHNTRTTKLRAQLLDWGATAHDDHVDALAYLPQVMDQQVEVRVIDPREGTYADEEDPNSLEAILRDMAMAEGPSWKDL